MTVNSTQTVIASILYCVVGGAAFLIMPVFIGAAAVQFALNESQVGYLASAVMIGSVMSSIAAVFWIRRINWRKAMLFALVILATGHVCAISSPDYASLLMSVILAGLGGGAVYSLALVILSDNDSPDRVFGYSVAAQVSFQVIGLLVFPSFIAEGGLDSLLKILLVMVLLSLFLLRWIPVAGKVVELSSILQLFSQPKVVYALFGCLFFFFNVGCFWAFIERMGDAAGYSAQLIGNSLAAGVAVGIAGSLCASFLGDRFGRLSQLFISAIGTVVAVVLLSSSQAVFIYVIAVAIYNFVWNYSLTYQYALVNAVDDTGRGVAIVPAFHTIGLVLGPAIAGMLVSANNFIAINILVAISVVISFLFFIPACKQQSL